MDDTEEIAKKVILLQETQAAVGRHSSFNFEKAGPTTSPLYLFKAANDRSRAASDFNAGFKNNLVGKSHAPKQRAASDFG